MTRRYRHSFEEDHDDVMVYRPESFEFPPARGRREIEVESDGSIREFRIGRGDAPEAVVGTRLEVALLDHDVIEVRTGPKGCRGAHPAARLAVVERLDVVAAQRDPAIEALLTQLSGEAYRALLVEITTPRSRHSLGPGFRAAVAAAAGRLDALGYTVARAPIAVGSGTSTNLIADRAGTGPVGDRGVVLVTAHLDSVNHEDGPDGAAPGADDNASGSAGVLEMGRVLSGRTWRNDLRLILFGGEEQGLFGSREYVAGLDAAERARIRAVVNMDMIARRNTASPGVLLEGAAVSQKLIDALAATAATYTGLAVSSSLNPFASDHVPFIEAGVPAVLTIEADDSANTDVHSARDTLATLDPELPLEILRMNVATVAGELDR